jgi:hypothetical protein
MPVLVHVAGSPAVAQILKDVLAQHGIEAAVDYPDANRLGPQANWIDLDASPEASAVWILDAADLERAQPIVDDFARGPAEPTGPSWHCPRCGEQVEPEFDVCWQCGQDRKP